MSIHCSNLLQLIPSQIFPFVHYFSFTVPHLHVFLTKPFFVHIDRSLHFFSEQISPLTQMEVVIPQLQLFNINSSSVHFISFLHINPSQYTSENLPFEHPPAIPPPHVHATCILSFIVHFAGFKQFPSEQTLPFEHDPSYSLAHVHAIFVNVSFIQAIGLAHLLPMQTYPEPQSPAVSPHVHAKVVKSFWLHLIGGTHFG